MGGFFSSDTPTTTVSTPVVSTPVVSTPDTTAAEEEARQEAVARNRRGMAATIATSDAGALQPATATKSLLGD